MDFVFSELSDPMRWGETWHSLETTTVRPAYIRVSNVFWRIYRRIARPPRRQIGGSSLRAIKRRAVRRPW